MSNSVDPDQDQCYRQSGVQWLSWLSVRLVNEWLLHVGQDSQDSLSCLHKQDTLSAAYIVYRTGSTQENKQSS